MFILQISFEPFKQSQININNSNREGYRISSSFYYLSRNKIMKIVKHNLFSSNWCWSLQSYSGEILITEKSKYNLLSRISFFVLVSKYSIPSYISSCAIIYTNLCEYQ